MSLVTERAGTGASLAEAQAATIPVPTGKTPPDFKIRIDRSDSKITLTGIRIAMCTIHGRWRISTGMTSATYAWTVAGTPHGARGATERRRERAYDRGVPRPATEARANNMRAVRRTGTQPELRLRRMLHAAGLRYRVDMRLVFSGKAVRPDVVFTGQRVAVFVDSCFWHCCPVHGTLPATNAEWWKSKLTGNVARDAVVNDLLGEHGWTVIRAWEHEATADTLERVEEAVRPPTRSY